MLIFNIPDRKKYTALLLSLVLSTGYFHVCCQSVLAQASELNFKVYNPDQADVDGKSAGTDKASADQSGSASSDSSPGSPGQIAEPAKSSLSAETPQSDVSSDKTSSETRSETKGIDEASAKTGETTKVLQGYVRIVPSGTKIPIVMDTAVDSDTSQEGDEFSARSVEDLTIDGTMVIPAGSIIRGRIATLNAPKHLNRSGSVALKFDTVTTPDNRQIPLVANLVARGGVVHARRGMKDIAIDSATFALPTLVALGIGAVAGHSSSSVGVGGGALIGAGVGAAVGLAILLAKKGKRVDVRPGDELKIELAEDLHMPSM